MPRLLSFYLGLLTAGLGLLSAVIPARAEETQDPAVSEILAQNRELMRRVQQQQQQIDELRQRLDKLQGTGPGRQPMPEPVVAPPEPPIQPRFESTALRAAREIRVSGEVGLGFFSSASAGAFPQAEFRPDDAKVFLEAPVWQNVYFFAGMEFATRESDDNTIRSGELYVDVEDLFRAGRDRTLCLRIGRFNIPFGEEYQYRSVMTNPLITHSVADIWGIDEGVQVYGKLGPVSYNLAVQNGSTNTRRDYNKDKAVTARLSIEPLPALQLSASYYRTGKLDVAEDYYSEIWFGGGIFGPLGYPATTRTFQANLFELDAAREWKGGRAKVTGGTVGFDDDSTTGGHSRRLRYFSFEFEQQLADRLYGAARYSAVRVAKGYPLVGLGDFGRFYYASPPTEDLHRLSLGLGYRFSPPLLWKMEYSWENGRMIDGSRRGDENMFSTELGVKF